MRAGPIGLFNDLQDVVYYATIQASITHDTREGMLSAAAAALMVFYLRQGYSITNLGETIWRTLFDNTFFSN